MTAQYIPSLTASFKWLAENEAAAVAASLPGPDHAESATAQMEALAAALDHAGLPPTSTLLLALAGRGSKGPATDIARSVARARFEKAREIARQAETLPSPALPTAGISEAQVHQVAHAAVESVLAMMPGAFAGKTADDRVAPMIESLAADVRWLKSTIDTERQLRRYREAHGPLPEHQAQQGPTTTEQRRNVVQHLASSLERDRFATHSQPVDMADGRDE